MADRKQFSGDMTPDPKLIALLRLAAEKTVTEEELREQRISFAYGNAPVDATEITKDSVRFASEHLKLQQ